MKKFLLILPVLLIAGCAAPYWVRPIPLRWPFDGVRMKKKPKVVVEKTFRISWTAEEGNWTGLFASTNMNDWKESVIISRHRPVYYEILNQLTPVQTLHVAESTEAITTNFAVVIKQPASPKVFYRAFSRWER